MLSVRAYLLLVLAFGFSATQDVPIPEAVTETGAETSSDVEGAVAIPDLLNVSDIICIECNCTKDAVDCSNRELSKPFEAEDWSGLKETNTDITDVDLSGNVFVALQQFPELPIKKLNLSNCQIELLEDAMFSNLKYITTLDLSKNKMSFVMGKRVFVGVPEEGRRPRPFKDLQYLSLAYNDIHSLSQDVFMFMPFLTFLDISGNPLVAIDQVTMGALGDLYKLTELRISQCDLETLPMGIFRRLKSLQRLDLSGNRFTVVPTALSEAIQLVYLNFNGNPIPAISEQTAISNLTKLQELHLSRLTKLRSITYGALGGLESLVKLYMCYNPRLTDLDPGFLAWDGELDDERRPMLEELYLNNNNISEIDSRLLDHWDHLTSVDLTANPYACTCNNQWMVDVLVPLIQGLETNGNTAKMICRKPYDYRGLTFSQLYESSKTLPCTISESLTDASGMETAVMYGIVIGVLAAFPIVLVVVILWKKGYFARCRKKSEKHYFDEEETDAF